MRKIVISAAVLMAFCVPAAASLDCGVTFNNGETAGWVFSLNTQNADGSFGGTVVEEGYVGNERVVQSQIGHRPVWVLSQNRSGGVTLASRNDPGWVLVQRGAHGSDFYGPVSLFHNNRVVAVGACHTTVEDNGGRPDTAATVPDMGN